MLHVSDSDKTIVDFEVWDNYLALLLEKNIVQVYDLVKTTATRDKKKDKKDTQES